MAKLTLRDNYRLEVYPSMWPRVSPSYADFKIALEDMAKSIKRHVDDVHVIDQVWDTKEVCSFCSLGWELDEHGVPICCEEAAREWVKMPEKERG